MMKIMKEDEELWRKKFPEECRALMKLNLYVENTKRFCQKLDQEEEQGLEGK
jgi:hypothetical protein